MSGSASSPNPLAAPQSDLRTLAIVVYGLYLGAVLTCGLAGVAGVVLAYIKRDDAAGTPWASHFENAIQAFWIWLGLFVIGMATTVFLIGFLVIGFAFVYFLYRTIKGLVAVLEYRPYV